MTEDDTFARLVRPTFEEMTAIYKNSYDLSGVRFFFSMYHWTYEEWADEYMARYMNGNE